MIILPIDKDNVNTIPLKEVFENLSDEEKEIIYILMSRIIDDML